MQPFSFLSHFPKREDSRKKKQKKKTKKKKQTNKLHNSLTYLKKTCTEEFDIRRPLGNIRPALISGFCSMKRPEVFYSPWMDGMLVHRRVTPRIKFIHLGPVVRKPINLIQD